MPRKDSRSNSLTFKDPLSFKPPVIPKPLPAYKPPMYFPKPTLFDSVKQGFGFGLGSSIAHSFMGTPNLFSGSSNKINSNCDTMKNDYNKCILENKYNDPKNTCYNLEKEYEKCKNE